MSYKNHFKKIKESDYFIRRKIECDLKNIKFDDEMKKVAGSFDTYFDMWTATYSDKFYDMSTIVRLGTIIEGCLKDYYQDKMGFSNRKELKDHINSSQNVFQQVLPWHTDGVLNRIKNQFSVDPFSISELAILQEAMLLRHLYAHNSGVLDQKFVENYKRLTSVDLSQSSSPYKDFELQDYYYFEPLRNISKYISGTEKFPRVNFPVMKYWNILIQKSYSTI